MATIYYDSDADLDIIRKKKVGDHRLRLSRPRPRVELEGQRRRRSGGSPSLDPEPREGRSGWPHGRLGRRRREVGRRGHGSRSRHAAARDLRERDRAGVEARRHAHVRARVLHPLQDGDAALERRRLHDRAEGAGPPRARDLRRGRRHTGAPRDPPGPVGEGESAGALLRERHRCHEGRRPSDDLLRRDRDGPLRRADRALRGSERARQGGIRHAGRGRVSAGDGVLRVSPRAQAHRGSRCTAAGSTTCAIP